MSPSPRITTWVASFRACCAKSTVTARAKRRALPSRGRPFRPDHDQRRCRRSFISRSPSAEDTANANRILRATASARPSPRTREGSERAAPSLRGVRIPHPGECQTRIGGRIHTCAAAIPLETSSARGLPGDDASPPCGSSASRSGALTPSSSWRCSSSSRGSTRSSQMPTDILPEIDIPVIAVVWQYGGLPPDEMEQRFTGNFERALTTTVNGIEHIESQSLYGVSVTKVFFHPGTKIEMANAQVTAISQTLLKQFPVGRDAAAHRQLQRVERPHPPGVDPLRHALRAAALRSHEQLPPHRPRHRAGGADAVALRRQAAAGDDRHRSAAPLRARALAERREQRRPGAEPRPPLGHGEDRRRRSCSFASTAAPTPSARSRACRSRRVNGATVTIGDVAAGARRLRAADEPRARQRAARRPHDAPQERRARRRSTSSSRVRGDHAERSWRRCRPSTRWTCSSISRVFVRAAVDGVVKEAAIAAGPDALMILLFLGSWRSTLIVVTSIPLSILVSLICPRVPRADAST